MSSLLTEIAPLLFSDVIEAFCVGNNIRKLSLFGSILTPRFGPESDVDILWSSNRGAPPDCSI